jgi:hypothetical protein
MHASRLLLIITINIKNIIHYIKFYIYFLEVTILNFINFKITEDLFSY